MSSVMRFSIGQYAADQHKTVSRNMASLCMGNFGAFKLQYNIEKQAENLRNEGYYESPTRLLRYQQVPPSVDEKPLRNIFGSNEVVWVRQRYTPLDERDIAPVARHKWLAGPDQPDAPNHWVPVGEMNPRKHERSHEEFQMYRSQPSTRCESWSTLRQLCPSNGRPSRISPPSWGSGSALPPIMTGSIQRRFPHVNGEFTRYQDDMYRSDRLFRLH